jgi:hypothetical protein
MPADEPRPNPVPAPVSISTDSAAGSASRMDTSTGARRFLPVWLLTLLAGAAAGSLAAFGGEKTFDAFALDPHYPANYGSTSGYERAAVRADVSRTAKQVVEMKKATVAYGFLGLLLGAAMGIAGGLARGSIRSGLGAVLVGGVTGAVTGAGLSAALVPVYFRFTDPAKGLILLFSIYAAIFAGVGAAGGLALGWGLGDRRTIGRSLIGGAIGALVGTFAFQSINSLAFPLLATFEPVPAERIPRLVVHLCVAIGTAALAGLAAGRVGNRPADGHLREEGAAWQS